MPGLYAAGDSLGTMQSGATYAAIGQSLLGCSVTGAHAGTGAAGYAGRVALAEASTGRSKQVAESLTAPLRRSGGFGPRWVTQMLQNTMIPYYVMQVKHGDRLQAALTNVEFFRDHLVPLLYASDQHELRLVHETRNMVLNAEMRLRASLFRTETRGCHYREDYPLRDDQEWLAWVVLKKGAGGDMEVFKRPIPAEWHPDPSAALRRALPEPGAGESGAAAKPPARRRSTVNLLDLTGKKALVIGAGGIGSALAVGLAQHGADVAVADRDLPEAEAAAARVRAFGCRTLAHAVDVTDEASVAPARGGTGRFCGGRRTSSSTRWASPRACPRNRCPSRRCARRWR